MFILRTIYLMTFVVLLVLKVNEATAQEVVQALYPDTDSQIETVSYESSDSEKLPLDLGLSAEDHDANSSDVAENKKAFRNWSFEFESTFFDSEINGSPAGEINSGFFDSPRITLGTQVGGFRIIGSYWQLKTSGTTLSLYQADQISSSDIFDSLPSNDSTSSITSITGNYGGEVATSIDMGDLYDFNVFFESVEEENFLEASTIDLEVEKSFITNSFEHQLSFGIRNANLSDSYHFEGLGSILGRTYNHTRVETSGIGLTSSLKGKVQLKEGLNAFLFYRLRGSILWGDNETSSTGVFGEDLIPGAINRPIGSRSSESYEQYKDSETMLIGEAQIGIEIDYKLRGAPSGAFIRAMLEYQNWETDFVAYQNVGWTAPSWSIVDVDEKDVLSLVGFSIGTGVAW